MWDRTAEKTVETVANLDCSVSFKKKETKGGALLVFVQVMTLSLEAFK